MGDIIFTGKKITEQSKVATWIADGGLMKLSAMGVVSQKGEEGVDLLIGEVPEKPVEESKSKCIAHIRPTSSWKGKFGFDWFRIGDTKFDGDAPYEDILGRYYTKSPDAADTTKHTDGNTWTAFFRKDPQPNAFSADNRLSRLKSLYNGFDYTMGKDKDGKPLAKRYYVPRMTLMARIVDEKKKVIESGTAELSLLLQYEKVDGKEVKPLRLEFEMDGKPMDASHPLVSVEPSVIEQKKLGSKESITVTCNSEFAEDKEMKIWAVTKDKDGKEEHELAGMLRMIAPGKKRTLKVVMVRVKTRAGIGPRKSLDEFTRNLKQALIIPDVVEGTRTEDKILIDLTRKENNHNNIDFNTEYDVVGANVKNSAGVSRTMPLLELLDRQLEKKYPGVYTSYFKLYFFANTCDKEDLKDDSGAALGTTSTAGFSVLNTKHGVMFTDHTPATIGHECMHGLGLEHTFSNDEFTFQAMKTDNVMDYSHLDNDRITKAIHTPIDRFSTNFWQWSRINENIK